MRRKRIKGVLCCLLCLVMLFGATLNTYAASYSSISSQFWGYGVSVSKKSNQKISNTTTVSKLSNKKSYAVTTTDSFTKEVDITFSSSCSSKIEAAISAKTGAVSGDLGAAIESKYSFSSYYTRTYTKTITVKVPAKTTYTLKSTVMGDKVTVYYKYFALWIETSRGSGTVYVPRYINWTCT